MKNFILFLALVLLWAPSIGQTVPVKEHTRSNGTVVERHYRTAPNSTKKDNYSTKGNTNPYTGKKGTKSPY
jgi:hypothetical protein